MDLRCVVLWALGNCKLGSQEATGYKGSSKSELWVREMNLWVLDKSMVTGAVFEKSMVTGAVFDKSMVTGAAYGMEMAREEHSK